MSASQAIETPLSPIPVRANRKARAKAVKAKTRARTTAIPTPGATPQRPAQTVKQAARRIRRTRAQIEAANAMKPPTAKTISTITATMPQPMIAIVQSLPPSGSILTPEKRTAFKGMIDAALDWFYPSTKAA